MANPFDDLSDEIVLHIFLVMTPTLSNLNTLKSLATLSLVCKRFHRISHDSSLQKSIFNISEQEAKERKFSIKQIKANYKELQHRYCTFPAGPFSNSRQELIELNRYVALLLHSLISSMFGSQQYEYDISGSEVNLRGISPDAYWLHAWFLFNAPTLYQFKPALDDASLEIVSQAIEKTHCKDLVLLRWSAPALQARLN